MVYNPNILELLNTPEDCLIYKHPVFDSILSIKDKFITKACGNSFGGYAVAQVKKARGLDKKQNWEGQKVTRKTPLDFCYFLDDKSSYSLVSYLEAKGIDQSLCGLAKVNHTRDTYALYVAKPGTGFIMGGILKEGANSVRVSSIPKSELNLVDFLGLISYNEDSYSEHAKDFRSYEEWLKNRNPNRHVETAKHGQKIDGKNMMHCQRLLDMAEEIAAGKGVIVHRPNREYLLSIRKGEVDLEILLADAENKIKEINLAFSNSNLPASVDRNEINSLLVKIRKEVYGE
jgi:hypothetical protein